MTWKQSDLINISTIPLRDSKKGVVKLANAKRPPEVTDLVDALSAMFGRIGMHAVCGLCFRGKLKYISKDHKAWRSNMWHSVGCCSGCPLLTATKCANKPLLCASWMCTTVQGLFPKTQRFLHRVQGLCWKSRIPWRAYTGGISEESTHHYTPRQLKMLRLLTARVNAWNEVQP